MVLGDTKRSQPTVVGASEPRCHKLSKAHSEFMLLVSCTGFAVLSWSRPWLASEGQDLS